ncbi:MAG: hypothetical protein IJW23_00665 [Lentisphaeria bacterium]|nr:hypothetical protein [Lentisphaeria bacterium]
MLNEQAAPFTVENYREMTDEGHVFLRNKNAKKKGNEILFSGITVESSCQEEVVLNALEDLKAFYRYSLGETFEGNTCFLKVSSRKKSGKSLKYTISIGKNGVTVTAETPRGAARALFRLQAMMRLRRAPFLMKGTFDSAKDLSPAVAYLAFSTFMTNEMDYPTAYHENYLKRLARTLYSGFHLNLQMMLFAKSDLLSEFDNPKAGENLETLRKIVVCAERFGLDVYLSYYLEPVKGDHPAFQNHPEIRGSRLVGTDNLYVCCCSHDLVRRFYTEQAARLFREVPGLGGLLMIAGCEGWLHCHTACAQTPDGRCECPRCRDLEPERSVADMFNMIAAGVKEVSPEAEFIVWNYGIHAWSDVLGEKFVSCLSKDCTVMANFDTGDDFQLEGAEGTYFDYSFTCVGPSSPYKAQTAIVQKRKMKMMAKCESGTPLEYCSLQYVPAMTRWERKFANIIKTGSAGAVFNWKFVGYTEGLSQELAGLMSGGEQKNILKKLAAQHFGEDNVQTLMQAWKKFDRAIDFHPFSIGSAGYFKGPFYIGPAQPLLLTTDAPADIPPSFYWRNGRSPLFMNTLSFVEPFGVKSFMKAVTKLEAHWSEGMEILEKLSLHPEDKYLAKEIKEHKQICRLFQCFLRTAEAMAQFYILRDSFQQEAYSPEQAKEKLQAMREIALSEISNTETALEILKENHRIAFCYGYRYGISVEMCEYKLKHTKLLIEKSLPQKYYGITFSRQRHPRWHF